MPSASKHDVSCSGVFDIPCDVGNIDRQWLSAVSAPAGSGIPCEAEAAGDEHMESTCREAQHTCEEVAPDAAGEEA